MLLQNDLLGGKVVPDPMVCDKTTSNVTSDDEVRLSYSLRKVSTLILSNLARGYFNQKKLPRSESAATYTKDGILLQKWRPSDTLPDEV